MDIQELDLDIDHYSLADILNLFHLSTNFTTKDLKTAKRVLMAVHPDKSGLDSTYFRFFNQAYRLLQAVSTFLHPQGGCPDSHTEFNDLVHDQDNAAHRFAAAKLSKGPGFNRKFNELFEEHYGAVMIDDEGHGEWMASEDGLGIGYDDAKTLSKALTAKSEVTPVACGNTLGASSLDATPNDNHPSSGKYEDLKHAYLSGTVIGVSESDYTKMPTRTQVSIEHERSSQDVTPMGKREAGRMQTKMRAQETEHSMSQAFRLVREGQRNAARSKQVWGKLLALTE